MGKNKENKHCRVFINFIFAWLKCRYKGKRTLHYNSPAQLCHSVGVQACHECGEHEQGDHDPEGIALCHIMPYSSTSSTPRLPASLCCALILPSALTVLTYNHTHDYLDGPFTCRYFAGINQ